MFLTEKLNVFLLKGLILAYSFQEIAIAFYSASYTRPVSEPLSCAPLRHHSQAQRRIEFRRQSSVAVRLRDRSASLDVPHRGHLVVAVLSVSALVRRPVFTDLENLS